MQAIGARSRVVVAVVTTAVALAAVAAGEEQVVEDRGTLRVAVSARAGPHSTLTPLVYWGGFQTKTPIYEPLVRLGPAGELLPGLLESWSASDDGREYTLRVRAGVVCHDGQELDARAVRDHLIRWRGNPGNRWLGSTDRFEQIQALDSQTVRVTLSEPWNWLRDAIAINPGHIVGAGAYDHEGSFRKTVGTGPFRLVEQTPNELYVLDAHDPWWQGRPGLARVEVRTLPTGHRETGEVLRELLEGRADLVSDGEGPLIPRRLLPQIERDPRYRVWVGPGSGVTYLRLNTARGPFADVEARRLCAAAIDRAELIAKGELGHATPSLTLFRAGYGDWPAAGQPAAPSGVATGDPVAVRMLLRPAPSERIQRHMRLLTTQLAAAGFEMAVVTADSRDDYGKRSAAGDFDLLLRTTHGAPYDPWISAHILLYDRGGAESSTAARSTSLWPDPALQEHLHRAFTAPNDDARRQALARVQARLDEGLPVVPLFVSGRVAVSRADVDGVEFGVNGYDLGLGTVQRTGR